MQTEKALDENTPKTLAVFFAAERAQICSRKVVGAMAQAPSKVRADFFLL
jgi:hypothetical protein